ncbi:unnamed protein product [Moneuplotes crassus]|uniref:Uncharacterized protein n=1 Tax=Euplotes crassus TaxID=5936 RepID=A0AAD2D2H7_EUPCR|nr:unnamed protein product [Moneuplotes crassus]
MNTSHYSSPPKQEGTVDFNDFLEYYTYVSALYDNDLDFDRMLTNTWNVGTNTNPASIPYAGISKTITKVNTKERWLNDHHRAIIHGKEQDPVNPHTSDFKVPYMPPKPTTDPVLMRPAGKLTLHDYEVPDNDSQFSPESYKHEPQHYQDPYYKSVRQPESKPRGHEYSRPSPPEKKYDYGGKQNSFESPKKPHPTNFPQDYREDDVASQYSHQSERSMHSHHSGYSHHSQRSIQSHASHASQYSSSRGYEEPQESYQRRGYAEQPDFYHPKQTTEYGGYKGSRYY